MGSENVAFSLIPAGIRKPGWYFEYNTQLANRSLPSTTQRVCLLGQRLAGAPVPANTLVNLFSDAEARILFGAGSPIHLMARAALGTNQNMILSAVAIDDAGGALAATGKFTFAGTATGTGQVTITLANDSLSIAINSGDTAAASAASLAAALATKPDWPITAGQAALEVNLTAKVKGTLGNGIAFTGASSAPGLTVTATSASAGYLAGGATDPSLAAALAAIYTSGHTLLVTSLADAANLTLLRNHLTAVTGPVEQRDARGVYATTGTLAAATTLAASVNHGWLTGAWLRRTPSLPYEVAASYAAVIASEPDPARPLNGLPLPVLAAPQPDQWASRAEQEAALNNGVTPIEIGPGQMPQIVRAITTYTLAANGLPDTSLLDITVPGALAYVRLVMRTGAREFSREKLTDKTIGRVRSMILRKLKELEQLGIVANVEALKPRLIVERDLQNPGQLNARIPTQIVDGLHVFGAIIDLL